MNEQEILDRIQRLRKQLTTIDIDEVLRGEHGYSKLWFPQNDPTKSKYAGQPGDILYKVARIPFETKAESTPESMPILGYGSTPDLDSDNEIILWDAFKESLPAFLLKGLMFWGHDWWSIPIGRWDVAEAREPQGTYLEGRILPTGLGKDIMLLVQEKVLNALSVGFRVITDSFDYEGNVRTIVKGELLETSVVHIGANPRAWFEAAKSKSLKFFVPELPADAGSHKSTQGGRTMDPELVAKLERLTKGLDPATGSIGDRFTTLQAAIDANKTLIVAAQAKANDHAAGLCTKEEMNTYFEKMKGDLTTAMSDIKALQNRANVTKMRYAVKDWRALLSEGAWLRDDKGQPLPAMTQKAMKLFNMEVDYNATQDGWLVKSMRDLLDHTLLMAKFNAVFHAGNPTPLYAMKEWHDLASVVDYFDPELAKAMATTSTGQGLEWVPTLFSAEFQTLYRLQPSLKNYLRNWDMPSESAKYPILTSGAVAYRTGQADVDNPVVLTKSNLGSGQILFNVKTIAAAIGVAPEQFEESSFDLTPVIREELVTALAEGEENCDINGDTSATHFDTGTGLTSGSDDVRTCWKGFRKVAVDISTNWNVQSTSPGVGDGTAAFVAKDIRYNRQLLGVMGKNPRELLHITSIDGFFLALSLSEVTKANEFGAASTWLTGELPALDGCEIYVSAQFPTNLNASGIYDASTTTQTGWVTINKRGWMKGTRRNVMIEFEKNIDVQQWLFVATMRKDMQKMTPTSRLPVAYGYNV